MARLKLSKTKAKQLGILPPEKRGQALRLKTGFGSHRMLAIRAQVELGQLLMKRWPNRFDLDDTFGMGWVDHSRKICVLVNGYVGLRDEHPSLDGWVVVPLSMFDILASPDKVVRRVEAVIQGTRGEG